MASNFVEHDEVGAAVAVFVDDEPVVDLWAGYADRTRRRSWQRDTLVNIFSMGKAILAFCALRLVDRGLLELDAPISRYWPDFEAHGKGDITVRTALAHQAGLPAIRKILPPLAMYDWALMTQAIAEEEPWWEPGQHHGYHVNTFGFLIGEILRRATGELPGVLFRQEIGDRLEVDFHFGVGPDYDSRIADFLFDDEQPVLPAEDSERQLLLARVYGNPPGLSGHGTVNTRAWRAAQYPSTNGHSNARAVAMIYNAVVSDSGLLSRAILDEAIIEHSGGLDFVLDRPSRFGLGLQLTQPERPLGPHQTAFGHFGAGGSLGFADPEARLAFAYTMNRPGLRWRDPRSLALVEAVYACL